ncbi:MAG: fluoride efflux transporter CrcB [Microbacteriaceae bacterium]
MIALLALAGGVGAIARFVLDGLLRTKLRTVLPLGTMIINVSGSLLLGFLTGLVLFAGTPDGWRLVLGTGFLGGYTTFSTASVETARLIQERRWLYALINGLGMLLLAVLAAAAGVGLAWLLHG